MSELPPRPSMQSSIYSDQRITRAKSILEKNLNKSRGAEVNTSYSFKVRLIFKALFSIRSV